MDIVRALAIGVARVLGAVLILVGLHALLVGEARAANYMDQGEASSICHGHLMQALSHPDVNRAYEGSCSTQNGPYASGDQWWYYYNCKVWDRFNQDYSCDVFGGGSDPFYAYPSTATCQARNTGFATDTYPHLRAGAVPDCVAGCKISYGGLEQNKLGGQVVTSFYQSRQYTGDLCVEPGPSVGEEQNAPPSLPKEECKPAGGGQTFCVQPNGDHCHTTSNGKKICWRPTETGTKHDGVDAQSRTNNNTAIPPSVPPNDGSSWTQTNQTTTSTTTNNTTTNYTVTNYTSGSSKPPKPIPNDDISEPGGDDEGSGTATPATDCAQTPQCAGGDAIGCAMLRQHHSMICREGSTTPTGLPDGDPESSVTEPVASLFQGDDGGSGPGLDLIDLDGWSGRGACPIALTIPNPFGGSFEMDESHLCMILDALAGLISLLAGVHGGWILLGGSRR